jgi:hypothetical protein
VPEVFTQLIIALLPIFAFLLAIDVVVPLAIRHEHPNHHDR